MHKFRSIFASIAMTLAGSLFAGGCFAVEPILYHAVAQDLPDAAATRLSASLGYMRGQSESQAIGMRSDLLRDSHGFVMAGANLSQPNQREPEHAQTAALG